MLRKSDIRMVKLLLKMDIKVEGVLLKLTEDVLEHLNSLPVCFY